MEKKILNRLVEWDVKQKTIHIHLNEEDRKRLEESKKELGYIDRTSNVEIIADYFNNDEFQEIHDLVFPSGLSWGEDGWSDEELDSYLEIRLQHPSEDEDILVHPISEILNLIGGQK